MKAHRFIVILPAMAVFCLGWVLTAQVQPPPAGASVPKVVRFTGTFHAANGLPPAPIESVTFSIYSEQQGGTSLWHEVQNVALDPDGHYTVLLGLTQNEGLPLELFSSPEPRSLGVQFNRPGEPEQPRVLLVSVPYALKAADADTLGGKPASAYLLAQVGGVAAATGDYPGGPGQHDGDGASHTGCQRRRFGLQRQDSDYGRQCLARNYCRRSPRTSPGLCRCGHRRTDKRCNCGLPWRK